MEVLPMDIEKTFFVHAYYAKKKNMTEAKEIPYVFDPNAMFKRIFKAFNINTDDPKDFKYFYETPSKECNDIIYF